MINKELKKRILEISYKKKLSHLGSCLTASDIIWDIYQGLGQDDRFVLSSGHAALALYVVLEKLYGFDADALFDNHGVHPNRDTQNELWASTGSLGHGIGIALGMALASPERTVACLVTDGEAAEGSLWESLEIQKQLGVSNLKVYCNANGQSAYRMVDTDWLESRLKPYGVDVRRTDNQISFLQGLMGHYKVMTKEEYELALEELE